MNTKIFYRSNFIRDYVKRPSPVSLNILLLHCQRQPQRSAEQSSEPTDRLTKAGKGLGTGWTRQESSRI